MTHVTHTAGRPSLIGHLLQLLRTATLERMTLPDVELNEIEERILLESYLVRKPPLLFAAPKPPIL